MKYIKLLIFAVLLVTCGVCTSCTDPEGAKKTLERNGYKPLKVGGYGWLMAERDKPYSTEFTAIAINGDTVSGVVTKGLFFRGSVVRLEE